jgi:hypothetical protein
VVLDASQYIAKMAQIARLNDRLLKIVNRGRVVAVLHENLIFGL